MKILNKKGLSLLLSLILFFTTLLSFPSSKASAYESNTTWETRYDDILSIVDTPEKNYGYSNTSNSASLAWDGAYVLDSLHKMYEFTGDTAYIAKMSSYINNMYAHLNDNDGDGYLGWGTDKYYGNYYEYAVHFGLIIKMWAEFILTVRNDFTLSGSVNPQGITYSAQADALESVINSDLIPKWNRYWNGEYGVYTVSWPDNINKSIPHNMYLAMSNALYLMSQVTPTKQCYKLWADEMMNTFKGHLTNNGSYYLWNYGDNIMSGNNYVLRPEDYGHACLDLDAAMCCNYNGGIFDERDLSMFANTIYDIMWNKDESTGVVSYYVDGTDDNGVKGYIYRHMGDFERWRSGIWQLLETRTNNNWPHGSLPIIMMYAETILRLHPSNSTPQSFSITTPVNGATNLNSTVSFSWQPSVNAADYTLQVATDSSFSNLVASESKIIGTNAVVPGLSHSTTYYWRVIARNAAGTTQTSSTSSFTTKVASTFTLTFSHLDSRNTGSPAGYHYMQALVDGEVVWEKDVAADDSSIWYNESVNITNYVKGKSSVDVKFRLYEKKAVTNYTCSAYFDDVSITNSDITNGGFEKSELWQYNEDISGFNGNYSTTYAKSGTKSYKLTLPNSIVTSIGDYCSVDQKFALINPTLYRLNLQQRDSRALGSLVGYHYKQILVDDQVVWEQDAANDSTDWTNVSIDVSPYCIGKDNITVKFRLYEKKSTKNYPVGFYWDAISITNTNLQNGSFETTSNWTYEENFAGLDGEYNATPYVGIESYKIYLPSNTASSAGNYCDIYQTCTINS